MSGPGPTPERDRATAPSRNPVGVVVRWAAFGCLLVPVTLLWCGSSAAGAVGAAAGPATVTGVCRLLMRRSQRVAARPPSGERQPRRDPCRRAGTGAREGLPHNGGDTPVG
ncbi:MULTISPECIES: hypothetical protein [unclassified Streptomyces]|uniref:hypothetical protein n=1 Tax=unclassified Streptomyces TaxID=2593676 RepID=UPI0015E16831|nr:hypothetical protein [Streptomyces sp. SM1]